MRNFWQNPQCMLSVVIVMIVPMAGFAQTPQALPFFENFDDTQIGDRGWYDGSSGTITSAEHITDSSGSFECHFNVGGTGCAAGKPARVKFASTSSVYMSVWVKFSDNWVGSGKPYHPHIFHFSTNEDDDYVGPSYSTLTTYVEVTGGKGILAMQDSKNVDTNCILFDDGSFQGCNGSFASYNFGETRSVSACNGLAGDFDGHNCFPWGDGTWYSARGWVASNATFTNGVWHHIEAEFVLNTIKNGVGQNDGKVRLWQNGNLIVSSDSVPFRTANHPNMQFDHFLLLPYIGDGSPVDQKMWIDNLEIRASSGTVTPPPNPPPSTGAVAVVNDLHFVSSTSDSVTLGFSAVADGQGGSANYEIRYAVSPLQWGSASVVLNGSCVTVTAPVGTMAECQVNGLMASTDYQFQLISYRGVLNQNAEFGGLSNLASASTTAKVIPPPPPNGNPPPTTNPTNNSGTGSGNCEKDANGNTVCDISVSLDGQGCVALHLGGVRDWALKLDFWPCGNRRNFLCHKQAGQRVNCEPAR